MRFKSRTPRVTTRRVGSVAARVTTPGSDHVRIETRSTPSGYQLVSLTVKGVIISFTDRQATQLINTIADALEGLERPSQAVQGARHADT